MNRDRDMNRNSGSGEHFQHCLICNGRIHRNTVNVKVLRNPIWLHDHIADWYDNPHNAVLKEVHSGDY